MEINGIYCGGRYKVMTVSFEMRMSHWVNAPIVERTVDASTVLDLSQDIWDLETVREEGDTLVLVMRKYPGLTNGVEVRIFPEADRFAVANKHVTLNELIAKLEAFR